MLSGPVPWLLLVGLLAGCQAGGTRGDLDDHTGQMGDATQTQTGAGDIYVKLAAGYMREGRMGIALQQAKKALEVDPGSVDAHTIIALIYGRLREWDLAELYYRQGIRLDPENAFILNAYGTFLCGQKRYGDADVQFRRALKNPIYPTPEVALTNAGICAGQAGDLGQAETDLRAALRRNPRFSVALLEMAKLSLLTKQYLSVRAYLQRYLAVARHTAESLWVGIQAETQLGDRDAVASYRLLLTNNFPDSQEVQLLRDSGIR